MRLLVDTDAFCKLAAVGLLDEAAKVLGATQADVERLPALPYMLRSSKKLRKQLGDQVADALVAVAESYSVAPPGPATTTALLTGLDNIDPGEVQLLALAASTDLLLLSGDKRAFTAIATVGPMVPMLKGKVVCLEAVLLALCNSIGVEKVRAAVSTRASIDKVFQVCFSASANPLECLPIYLRELRTKVAPLELWLPPGGA